MDALYFSHFAVYYIKLHASGLLARRHLEPSPRPFRHPRPPLPPVGGKGVLQVGEGCGEKVASLPPEVPKTLVCDREADTYETIARTMASGCHILVRSRINRHSCDGLPIWDKLLESEPVCTYEMVVRRKGEATRTALMELRWERFDIKCPSRGSGGVSRNAHRHVCLHEGGPRNHPLGGGSRGVEAVDLP